MKKKIITAAILLVLGICAITAGVFLRPLTRSYNVAGLTDDMLGKTVNLCVTGESLGTFVDYVEETGMFTSDYKDWYYSSDDGTIIRITVAEEHRDDIRLEKIYENNMTLTGTVRKASDDMVKETGDRLIGYLDTLSSLNDDLDFPDEIREEIRNSISGYYIEITATDISTMKLVKTILYIAGALLTLASVVLWISVISKKSALKIALIFAGVIVLAAGIVLIICSKQIALMSNIRKDGNGIYYLNYDKELKTDEMLDAGITTDKELLDWLNKAEFHGLSLITLDNSRYACASFSAKTPDGNVLLGRNFDYPETDMVVIYTDPENGYASYSTADLAVIGLGAGAGEIDPDSLIGKFIITATPYLAVDGVNEAGLGISTLELATGELHEDKSRPDLFIYTAVRAILDRCATVDEALDLLNSYDIHTHNGTSLHLFIADKSGRSVVVEWFDGQMYVNELNAVTNSVLTPGDRFGEGSDWRLGVLTDGLAENGNVLTPEQARDLLKAVSVSDTEWSVVYDLDRYSADIYLDTDYSYAYHYGE